MVGKTPRLSVSLSASEIFEVQKLADRSNVSCSWVVRQAVLEYLERYSSSQPSLPLQIIKKED
jgi:predicted transcriptional regulator